MTRIVWSPHSLADLEGIRDHIARDSERYASLVVGRLVAAPDRLLAFPESGRVVPEFERADLRELIIRPYRLVYRVRGDAIEVVTVFHAARMFPDIAR